jgi:hypothetical protein
MNPSSEPWGLTGDDACSGLRADIVSIQTAFTEPAMRSYSVAVALVFLAGQALAGSVSGQTVDETGAPLAGVNVEIVYQTYNADKLMGHGASIKAEAVTGADGRYRVDIGHLPPGEYSAHAYTIVDNGGRPTNIDLVPDDPANFAGTDDTVRNFAGGYYEFTADDPYGNGGVFVVNNAIGDFTDLTGAEVTLESLATARTIVRTVRPSGEGLIVSGVPFGTYRASVALGGQPMRIALWGPNSDNLFRESVVHDFTMGWLGNQFQVQVRP